MELEVSKNFCPIKGILRQGKDEDSIPPDSSFKKEQLIIGGGRLQQAWAFEQPASRRASAAFEGGG